MNQNEIKKYQVLASPLNGYEKPYLVYAGREFHSKDIAQRECNGCNEIWGKDIKFEVIEAGSVIIPKPL